MMQHVFQGRLDGHAILFLHRRVNPGPQDAHLHGAAGDGPIGSFGRDEFCGAHLYMVTRNATAAGVRGYYQH